MAKRRRRGFGGLGVLPVVGAITLPKLIGLAVGAYFAKKALSKPTVTTAAAPTAQTPVANSIAAGVASGSARASLLLMRPGSASPAAARDILQSSLRSPIQTSGQLATATRAADSYITAAAKAGVIDPHTASRLLAQDPVSRIGTVAASIGVSPTILQAATTALPTNTLTVQKTAVISTTALAR